MSASLSDLDLFLSTLPSLSSVPRVNLAPSMSLPPIVSGATGGFNLAPSTLSGLSGIQLPPVMPDLSGLSLLPHDTEFKYIFNVSIEDDSESNQQDSNTKQLVFNDKIPHFNRLLPVNEHKKYVRFMRSPSEYSDRVEKFKDIMHTKEYPKREFKHITDPFKLFPGPSFGWYSLYYLLDDNDKYADDQVYDLIDILVSPWDITTLESILKKIQQQLHHLECARRLISWEGDHNESVISGLIDFYKFKITLINGRLSDLKD